MDKFIKSKEAWSLVNFPAQMTDKDVITNWWLKEMENLDISWRKRIEKVHDKILKKARITDYADRTEYDECADIIKYELLKED